MGETVEEDEEEDCLAEELWEEAEEDARAEAVNEAGEEEAVEEDEEKSVLSRDVWPTRIPRSLLSDFVGTQLEITLDINLEVAG